MDLVGDHGHGKNRTPHVLVLAHPAGGHLPPAFHTAVELAQRGILVTFVTFNEETSALKAKHEAKLRSLDSLRFHPLPRGKLPPNSPAENLLQQPLADSKLLESLAAGPEPPTCMMVSMFHWWAKELAQALKLPRYTILGSGAGLARFTQDIRQLFAHGHLRMKDDDKKLEKFDGEIHIAGMPSLAYHDFPAMVRHNPTFYLNFARTILLEADGVLVNTFHGLEAEVMDSLRSFAAGNNGPKFYAVGPIAPLWTAASDLSKADRIKRSDDEDCLLWLDSQPASSVVYVCLGSQFSLKPNQTRELGFGLEKSQHRFLWVLPESQKGQADDGEDFLSPGFEKRVEGHGYVLRGWEPQVKVLSHPSVGAFLTHCGWNSCLEAISRAMRVICFPVTGEQQLNCRYLVSKLKIGAEICWAAADVPDPNAVEAAIRLVMEGEDRGAMQGRVEALQAAMIAALGDDGSSIREREELARDIRALQS